MLERSMVAFALLGAEWVLYLLVFLSIVSVAIMIERVIFYAQRKIDLAAFSGRLVELLEKKDLQAATSFVQVNDGMEAQVVKRGLENMNKGREVARELMAGEMIRQRARFERRLMFLGTLGNNAPFIGLFGTVLGIIRAFRDLSVGDVAKGGGNVQAVMAGISEALVATAVGLAVALPAVVAFNYFKAVVKGVVTNTEALTRIVYAEIEKNDGRSS